MSGESPERRAAGLFPAGRLLLRLIVALVVLGSCLIGLARPARAGASGRFYVDSTCGDDANDGTSPETAWRTLAPLHSRTFEGGDVIHFRRGSSWDGGLRITSSGVEGNPITYTTYGDAAAPPPAFSSAGLWSSAITISGSWIVLEGVLVRDAHEAGVYIEQHADHNIVRDIEATRVGIGVAVHGRHNVVTRSLFHGLTMVVNTPGGDDDWGALGVCIYNSYNEVSHNTMRGCSAPSGDFGADGGAVEIYARYGTVEGTRIHANWSCSNAGFLEIGGVAGSGVRDTIVSYNVTRNSGIFLCLHLDGNFACTMSGLRVENNSVIEEGEGWAVLAFVGGAPTPGTLSVRNNIFDVGSYSLFTNGDGFTRSNNLYHLHSPATQLGFALDPAAGERLGDPLFVSRTAQDYRLRPGSPAIDGGMPLGHTQDRVGTPVPLGSLPDMGAYEAVPNDPATLMRSFLPRLILGRS